MPIKFACPNCGHRITAPDTAVGRTGKCPQCQNSVTIPARQATEPPPVPAQEAAAVLAQELRPTPIVRSSSPMRRVAIGVGVGLGVIVFLGLLFGGKKEKPPASLYQNPDVEIGLLTERVDQLEQDKKELAGQVAAATSGEKKAREDADLLRHELVEARKAAARAPTAKLVGPDASAASTEIARLRAELMKAQRGAENQKQIYEKELEHWKGIGSMFLAAVQKLDANSKQALTDACKAVVADKKESDQPAKSAQADPATPPRGTHHLADTSAIYMAKSTADPGSTPLLFNLLTFQSHGSSGADEDDEEGRWIIIEKDAQVRIVKREYGEYGVGCFIQILSGKHQGKEGWINDKRLLSNE